MSNEVDTNRSGWRTDAYRKRVLDLGVPDTEEVVLSREALIALGYRVVDIEAAFGLGIEPTEKLPSEIFQPYERELRLLLKEAVKLFLLKNEQYGNAILRTGALGSAVALTGDTSRLRVMLFGKKTEEIDRDNVRDKFMDVLVQAAIGIMMVDRLNLTGEE